MTTVEPVPQIPQEQLTPELLRAWSWHRQGLRGALAGADPAMVLDEAPEAEDLQLLSGSDSLMLLRRNSADMCDETGAKAVKGMTGSALTADLSDHPIVDRGRIIGLWQYDPDNGRIAWWTFEPASDGVLVRVAQIERWITGDLGDFRSFSRDSSKSRATSIARLDALRQR